ncbi:MAG: hypothetical protein M5U22_01220 [Thermoleophilia bacterium]|nr:hypothetical protein [Thermoleophilia bacterium]
MDYGDLLKSAWRVSWHHKYLWILGFFAAEAGGCNFSANYSFGPEDQVRLPGGTRVRAADFLTDHWQLILLLAAGAVGLALVFLVLRVIATGGLVQGADAACAGEPAVGLGPAWRRGLAVFWRLVALWLLVALIAMAGVLVLVVLLAIPVVVIAASGGVGPGRVIALVLLGLGALAVLAPAGVALWLVWTWATRALVLENVGPGTSLRLGWRILRANPGHSVLSFLLQLAISIAVGIPLVVFLILVGLPVIFLIWRTGGDLSAFSWGGLALLAFVVLGAASVYQAAVSTYLSAYWTIAYRQLTRGRPLPPTMAGPYPPAGPGTQWNPPRETG